MNVIQNGINHLYAEILLALVDQAACQTTLSQQKAEIHGKQDKLSVREFISITRGSHKICVRPSAEVGHVMEPGPWTDKAMIEPPGTRTLIRLLATAGSLAAG
jgi:hypothetical protein